jgi:SAM-dependent methyltransferase
MSNQNIEYLKKHYENFPYPIPINDLEKELENGFYFSDPSKFWHKIWPEKKFSEKKLNIFIAGCGTKQAAIIAKCNPEHSVIGADISKKSIDSSEFLKKKYSLNNLELLHDDFRNITFTKKFDLIICSGVIHHLEDPNSGLNYLRGILEPEGVIDLMVYGDKSNSCLNFFKQFFKKINLKQDETSIIFLKNFINSLNPGHPLKNLAGNSIDMSNNSGIVDLLLHQSEKFFSIKEILSLLKKNDLVIKSFIHSNFTSLSRFFFHSPEILQNINNLKVEDKWDIAQILNWDDRKINFFCTNSKNIKHSFAYNVPDFREMFIHCRAKCFFENTNNKLIFVSEKGEQLFFNNINLINNFQNLFTGKKKIKELTKDLKDNEKKNLLSIISLLYENHFIDISFHPIQKKEFFFSLK